MRRLAQGHLDTQMPAPWSHLDQTGAYNQRANGRPCVKRAALSPRTNTPYANHTLSGRADLIRHILTFQRSRVGPDSAAPLLTAPRPNSSRRNSLGEAREPVRSVRGVERRCGRGDVARPMNTQTGLGSPQTPAGCLSADARRPSLETQGSPVQSSP